MSKYFVTIGAMRFESQELTIEAVSPEEACRRAMEEEDGDGRPGDRHEPWVEFLATEEGPATVPATFTDPDSATAPGHTFDRRELATILAGLRFWQRHCGTGHIEPEMDVASDGDTLDPLTLSEIDSLCERLNIDDRSEEA